MNGLSIRQATPADTEAIARILGEPGREAIGIVGDERQAREFGMALIRLPDSPQGWKKTVVAELDGNVIGIMQAGSGPLNIGITPRLLWLALRTFRWRVVSVMARYRVRRRVDIPTPEGTYYVSEIDVDPRYRNRGVGGALLDHAERAARREGFATMALHTTVVNPARRLYERHGFSVVETRTDPAYERHTGIAGRHLMVKELS